MIYILEGSGAGNIYQIEAIDPERKELKVSLINKKELMQLIVFASCFLR